MDIAAHRTVGEVARHFGTELWRIRRVVDELDSDLPRLGRYRLIPESLLPMIGTRLKERGWLSVHLTGSRS